MSKRQRIEALERELASALARIAALEARPQWTWTNPSVLPYQPVAPYGPYQITWTPNTCGTGFVAGATPTIGGVQ